MYESGRGEKALGRFFFKEEYMLNYKIGKYRLNTKIG